jgi:hypothetical protein
MMLLLLQSDGLHLNIETRKFACKIFSFRAIAAPDIFHCVCKVADEASTETQKSQSRLIDDFFLRHAC